MVEPMSPRLASAMARRPASRAAASTSSRAARPAEPIRSKNATWGLTTGTTPAKASTQAVRRCAGRPACRPGPRRSSSPADGSIPAHSGPVAATARATRPANPSVMLSSSVRRPVAHRMGRLRVRLGHGRRTPWPTHHAPISSQHPPAVPAGPGRWPCPPGRRRPRPAAAPRRPAPRHHPAHPDDGGVGVGGPDVEHGPDGDRVDRRPRQPAAGRARAEHGRRGARGRWPCRARC